MPGPSARVIANYALWRIGRRPVLPGYFIQKVPVVECGEPLVAIEGPRILLDHRLGTEHLIRSSALEALRLAANALPDGMQLLIVEGFRSRQRQEECFAQERSEIAARNPQATADELDRLTSLIVANPNNQNSGGHQTGGAVDLTVADAEGNELWMGTEVQQFTPETPTAAATEASVRHRREQLSQAMTSAGFVNYPGEWWHFAIGDRLWAAYRRKPNAKFGAVL